MAKYTNLSLGTNSHAGTELDPYSWADFQTSVNAAGDTTYYLKGSKNLSPSAEQIGDWLHPSAAMSFLKWPGETNPWRVRLQTGSGSVNYIRGTWKGGIIYFYNPTVVSNILTIPGNLYLYTMNIYIRGTLNVPATTSVIELRGSNMPFVGGEEGSDGITFDYPMNCEMLLKDSLMGFGVWTYHQES